MMASGIGNIDVLLTLLLAHMLGDFAFQSTSWVEDKYINKHRSTALYKHGITHAILSMAAWVLLLGWSLDVVWVVTIIATTHCLIDILKSHSTNHDISWFVVDQTLHIAVIIGVWSWFTNQPQRLDSILSWLFSYQTVAVVLAYFVVSRPVSILIGLICKKWANELGNTNSLPMAGALIGILERVLVLTFMALQENLWVKI